MSAPPSDPLHEWFPLLLLALALAGSAGSRALRLWRSRTVKDGPPDEAYGVYTRDFDKVLSASDVAATLPKASPDVRKGYYHKAHAEWPARIAAAGGLRNAHEGNPRWTETKGALQAALAEAGAAPQDLIVSLLIDQSGSMRGDKIGWASLLAAMLVRSMATIGAKSEILGFTTAGWHGGFAREAWIEAGKPKRPGRLAALMHLIYKSADDQALDDAARDQMLDPALLHENLDGEALLWAADRLRQRREPIRLLVVVSDGAPVDDSTLMANGPSYLFRHLKAVLAELAGDDSLTVGGLGIGHDVGPLYPLSERVDAPEQLPDAVGRLLTRMLAVAAGKG